MTSAAQRPFLLRIPREPWPYLRVITVTAMLALAIGCLVHPSLGLPILWGIVVPALPLVWVLAPGIWRNVCPMATVNQIPRLTRITRGRTLPPWVERHGYTIGASLFFITISLRPSFLQTSGPGAAVMLVVALGVAFVGGTLYRGKSGFCGSVCPLRATQSVYSRAPGAVVEHAHCRPCVGCTTNCQDLLPKRALLADLAHSDGRGESRWVFAGLLPGFIFGFSLVPVGTPYGKTVWFLAAWALFSLGLLTVADSYTRLGRGRLTALWGAAALVLFYWTNAPTSADAIAYLADVEMGDAAVWEARAVILVIVAIWLARGLKLAAAETKRDAVDSFTPVGTDLPMVAPDVQPRRLAPHDAPLEQEPLVGAASTGAQAQIIASAVAAAAPVAAPADSLLQIARHGDASTVASAAAVIAGSPPVQIPDRRGPGRPDRSPTIIFWPDGSAVPVPAHEPTVAAAARQVGISLPEGCGTGLCGCDPVYIVSGADGLAPPAEQERSTLERLGLPANARLACATRVIGDVVISLEPIAEASAPLAAQALAAVASPSSASAAPTTAAAGKVLAPAPADVNRIVIVGNGVAGITAASHMRRLHPDCSIDLVSRSPHPFYNRIAITRLIHRPQGLGSLQLMPDRWYEDQRVTQWLNTSVARIDRDGKEVVLGTGQALPYDRLIIATGARWAKPNLPGITTPGTFGLREAADAIRIRAYAQSRNARRAVVLGGGLLGLEVAEALAKLGIEVTVVERGDTLSGHVLDAQASRLLQRSIEAAGVKVRLGATVAELRGERRLDALRLDTGELIAADLAVVCVGIEPMVSIARDAGLEVGKGIVVDEHMRTSDPSILACGDAAEFDGKVGGHWAIGAAQAEVAAVTAFGGSRAFRHSAVPTVLKLDDLSVLSVGDISGAGDVIAVAASTNGDDRYQVTFMDGAHPVGLIAINGGGEVDAIVDSIVHGTALPEHLDPRGELPGPRLLREVS